MFAEKLECSMQSKAGNLPATKAMAIRFFAKWSGSKHFSHRVTDQSLGLYTLRDWSMTWVLIIIFPATVTNHLPMSLGICIFSSQPVLLERYLGLCVYAVIMTVIPFRLCGLDLGTAAFFHSLKTYVWLSGDCQLQVGVMSTMWIAFPKSCGTDSDDQNKSISPGFFLSFFLFIALFEKYII